MTATPAFGATAQSALRREVARFRAGEDRRVFPPVVHVGMPSVLDVDFVDLPDHRLDHTLRTEVLGALLSRARPRTARPVLWLTRSGSLVTEDVDLRWYAAARSAWGEVSLPLLMVVITRAGWYDVRTGGRREWKRLRIRS